MRQQREPFTRTRKGQILDGRTRFAACKTREAEAEDIPFYRRSCLALRLFFTRCKRRGWSQRDAICETIVMRQRAKNEVPGKCEA